jgi:hypothetical protein
MKSIAQTKFLSENYSTLHGLKAVPVGLCLLLISFWANGLHSSTKSYSLPIVFALGSMLLFIAIDEYYKRTFGEVKTTSASRHTQWIGYPIFAILTIIAFWADVTYDLPINLYGLLFAIILLIGRPKATLPLNKFSITKLILSISIILASISPLYLGANWWNTFGIRTTILGVTMIIGMLMVIEGVIWHTLFIKSLPTAEAKDE